MISTKNKNVALLLCIFGGFLGLHQFYVGRVGKGILYLFTVGLFGIGWFVDIFLILFGGFKDSEGAELKSNNKNEDLITEDYIYNEPKKNKKWPWIIAIIMWIIGIGYIYTNTIVSIISFIIGIFACPFTDKELKEYDFYKAHKPLIIIATIIIWIIGVGSIQNTTNNSSNNSSVNENVIATQDFKVDNNENKIKDNQTELVEKKVDTTNKISLSEIPNFNNTPYIEINGNKPFFDDSELTTEAFENYSELDNLGRVGIATACIERGMNDKPRGEIKNVNPTGWQSTKYEGIDGSNLYNRCHIIANQLTGEDANEKNLMTGTRYFNTQGMERFENQVAEYINNTDNHVLYRVTPMFENEDLVAKGALIEAKSVEDNGKAVQFNVFCYNVQPGIEIDYKTGNSKKIEDKPQNTDNISTVVVPAATENSSIDNDPKSKPKTETSSQSSQKPSTSSGTQSTSSYSTPPATPNSEQQTYILNTNTKKFHYPWCSSVNQMKEKNKRVFTGTRDNVISQGYSPCGRCSP